MKKEIFYMAAYQKRQVFLIEIGPVSPGSVLGLHPVPDGI